MIHFICSKKCIFLRVLQDFYFLACYNLHVRISKIAVSLDDILQRFLNRTKPSKPKGEKHGTRVLELWGDGERTKL